MATGEYQRSRFAKIGLRLVMAAAVVAIGLVVLRGGEQSSETAVQPAALVDPLAALQARVKENPKDGEAWTELAARYFDAGKFELAVESYGSAIKQAPRSAALWSARGEARVMASARDPMPAAAATDFETAFGLDPKDPRARYFLAVRQVQAGDHQGAIDAWLALLADTPPGAVWEADLRRTIEQVGKINGIAVASRLAAVKQPGPASSALAAIPGPNAEDLSRASAMPPSEQRNMAEGMVARLEARLRSNPTNVDGWVMLIRSRVNLGQPDQARAALNSAVAANPGETAHLREQAAMLGVR
jgi:cytochrome c-type biogenesis protein CcmH